MKQTLLFILAATTIFSGNSFAGDANFCGLRQLPMGENHSLKMLSGAGEMAFGASSGLLAVLPRNKVIRGILLPVSAYFTIDGAARTYAASRGVEPGYSAAFNLALCGLSSVDLKLIGQASGAELNINFNDRQNKAGASVPDPFLGVYQNKHLTQNGAHGG